MWWKMWVGRGFLWGLVSDGRGWTWSKSCGGPRGGGHGKGR